MKGKWVYGVMFDFNGRRGYNSVYANSEMAYRKQKRMQRELDRNKITSQKVTVQKIMYFADKVEEGSFLDVCSVCGCQIKDDKNFTRTGGEAYKEGRVNDT